MSIFYVTPVSTDDYRRRAKRRLPRFLFDYIDGGANSERTLATNVADFNRYHLKQHVLRNVDGIDTSTTLLGESITMPLAMAPVGMTGMFRRRGEVQAAAAATSAGIPFTTSTVGICPVDEIARAIQQPFWFQLYMLRDRDVVTKLLERAQTAGCDTLVFTVDLPLAGMRLRDYRNGMLGGGTAGKLSKLAQIISSPFWAVDVGLRGKPHIVGNLSDIVPDPEDLASYKSFIDAQFDPSVTWDDIAWLRSVWPGKILIKGVVEVDDAKAALDTGADGIVVSNHGGRQLDGIASSISKLSAISAAVDGQAPVLFDGGVRSGIDVVKALALGADTVLIGRPWVYALAAQGQQGVRDLLDIFRREIATAMGLMGVTRVDQINSSLIDGWRG